MNPFDLNGPQFLVLYIYAAVIVVIAVKLVVDDAERGRPPALPLSDPYLIAWLRGGTPEAARIAVLALTDRGLLAVHGDNLVYFSSAQSFVREPIESAILARCAQSGTAATAFLNDPVAERACASYQARLEAMQLIPDAECGHADTAGSASSPRSSSASLWSRSVALRRGRYNIAFLVNLTCIALLATWRLARRRRTQLGNRMLKDLRRLFRALRQRAANIRQGAMTSDAMLLAAVFGLSALPATGFADLLRIYKKAASSGGDCGSSCGSGCGGGGGGGGCGGCGSGS